MAMMTLHILIDLEMAGKEIEREGRTIFDAIELSHTLRLNCEGADMTHFQRAIFIVNEIAICVWSAIEGVESYSKIGTVEVVSNSQTRVVSELYCCEGDGCLVVRNVGAVPQSLLQEWAGMVLLKGIRDLIVFEGMHMSKYNQSLDSRIRVLCSSFVDESKQTVHSALGLQPLDVGNIVDGCAAAIFCRAELNEQSAVIYVVVRDAPYTIGAARSLEVLQEEISRFLGGRDVSFPGLDFHRQMIRKDGFLYSTETMFS